MTIGLIVFYFLAAVVDLWGFVLGTLPVISGFSTIIAGMYEGLTWGDSSTVLFTDSNLVSSLLVAGALQLLIGLGVTSINAPI